MIEFILDILFNNPESISFALFGAIKKAKKAKKLIRQMEEQGIPELDSLKSEEETGNIPQFDNSIFRTPITPTSPGATSYKPEFPYRGKQIIIDSENIAWSRPIVFEAIVYFFKILKVSHLLHSELRVLDELSSVFVLAMCANHLLAISFTDIILITIVALLNKAIAS